MTRNILERLTHYEDVRICNDLARTGLFAIIAIHNTSLGPAIGGCRCVPYSSVESALQDVLLLSQAMTRKCAITDLPFGGGKAVIMRPKVIKDRKAFFGRLGEFVHSFGGRYFTAVDSGTTEDDLAAIAEHTPFVCLLPDPDAPVSQTVSWLATQTVVNSMKAAAEFRWGVNGLSGHTVAIQGLGKVGTLLAAQLLEMGCQLIATDIDSEVVREFHHQFPSVEIVSPQDIIQVPCDIFAPCALGGVLTVDNIHALKAKIVCGVANNPVASSEVSSHMFKNDITYIPDFVANSGGVILAAMQLKGASASEWEAKARAMTAVTQSILSQSVEQQLPTDVIAVRMANERIDLA